MYFKCFEVVNCSVRLFMIWFVIPFFFRCFVAGRDWRWLHGWPGVALLLRGGHDQRHERREEERRARKVPKVRDTPKKKKTNIKLSFLGIFLLFYLYFLNFYLFLFFIPFPFVLRLNFFYFFFWGVRKKNYTVSCFVALSTSQSGWLVCPTSPFTILKPQNPRIHGFYVGTPCYWF